MRALLFILLWLTAATCRAELPAIETVLAFETEAMARTTAGQFDSLLADADKYQTTRERFVDGRWKLASLMKGITIGFNRATRDDAEWKRLQVRLDAFARAHAGSSNAWVMLAQLHMSRAAEARGGHYIDEVSPAELRIFEESAGQARTLLDRHKGHAGPAWFDLRLNVGGALGEPAEALDRLFDAAIQAEPDYQATWFSRFIFLRPQWGGSADAMAALINRAARTNAAPEGSGMMARLLWVSVAPNSPVMMDRPDIDWRTVKASYEDVLKRYPDDFNAQRFFFQSCAQSDKAEAQHLLTFIKLPPSPAGFANNLTLYGLCVSWANGKIPSFVMRDHTTGKTRTIQ